MARRSRVSKGEFNDFLALKPAEIGKHQDSFHEVLAREYDPLAPSGPTPDEREVRAPAPFATAAHDPRPSHPARAEDASTDDAWHER